MNLEPKSFLTDLVSMGEGASLVEKVNSLQSFMLDLPQVKCEVFHRFAPGIYVREVTAPAGTLAVGHWQKTEHLNIMLKGRVTVLNDDGTTTELVAPMIFVGKPGRKIGLIHEDMVWQNIYATTETDVEKLEEIFLDKDAVWDEHLQQLAQKLLPPTGDRDDYQRVLEEFGVTEEFARAESEREDNMIDLPYGSYKIKVGNSGIEGKGLMATADIQPGEIIAPARIGDKRTIAGRFTNHSPKPNARPVRNGHGGIDLVALREISGCHGGHDGEEITIDYRESLRLAMAINQEKQTCQQ